MSKIKKETEAERRFREADAMARDPAVMEYFFNELQKAACCPKGLKLSKRQVEELKREVGLVSDELIREMAAEEGIEVEE